VFCLLRFVQGLGPWVFQPLEQVGVILLVLGVMSLFKQNMEIWGPVLGLEPHPTPV
jgi:hypothetical protein